MASSFRIPMQRVSRGWRRRKSWLPLALTGAFVLAVPAAALWPNLATFCIAANVSAAMVLEGFRWPRWVAALGVVAVNLAVLGGGVARELVRTAEVEPDPIRVRPLRWCPRCNRGLVEKNAHTCLASIGVPEESEEPVELVDAPEESGEEG